MQDDDKNWVAAISYFDSFEMDSGRLELRGKGLSPYEAVKSLEEQLISKEYLESFIRK